MYRKATLVSATSLLAMLTAYAWSQQSADTSRSTQTRLYDPDSSHPWNELHAALLIRAANGQVYGADTTDPLLWPESKYLLEGASHQRAVRALDAILATDGGLSITDPLHRAVLQSDLWAVFDWASSTNSRDAQSLQDRLAKLIARLALTRDEIQNLPDTYAAAIASKRFSGEFDPTLPERPFLPPDLLQSGGRWVNLGIAAEPVAPAHTRFASGRSVFMVLIRLPEGRQATLDYLKSLSEFPTPWIKNSDYGQGPGKSSQPLVLNPKLPQFPAETQLALVRQMMLVDSAGSLCASPIVQSVQLRVYAPQKEVQPAFEFHMSREAIFAGEAGGLRAVERDERAFVQFLSLPGDPLEASRAPQLYRIYRCADCHRDPGVFSLLSFTRNFGPRSPRLPVFFSSDEDRSYLVKMTVTWKQQQQDWGLYRGLTRR
jgi:hypothetical protein